MTGIRAGDTAVRAALGSGLVTFDVTLHVGDGCPLNYHVDQKATVWYVGETGTSATITFPDQALLTLAAVAREAAGVVLSAQGCPDWAGRCLTMCPPDAPSQPGPRSGPTPSLRSRSPVRSASPWKVVSPPS